MKILDISRPLRRGTDIVCRIPDELPVYKGHACEEYGFELRSHVGCYYETSAHLFRGGTMTSDVPVEQLFMPALVARLDGRRSGVIEPDEIVASLGERLRKGDALIVDTAGAEQRHFSRSCGTWMAEQGVALLAATLRRYDTGFVDPTGVFVELFRAEIPILAEVTRVDEIAHERVVLIVLPMAIEGVCTAPCRAVVLDGEPGEVDRIARMLRPELAEGALSGR